MRLEPVVTVSHLAGAPWRRSMDPVVIKLLLQRGQGGENRQNTKIGRLWSVTTSVTNNYNNNFEKARFCGI